jgi:hypothetical protein
MAGGYESVSGEVARNIPAFSRAGNLNTLLGEKNSLFGRVGNLS